MQIGVIHVKREEIRPKRVGDDFRRDCSPRGESLFTFQQLNPLVQTPVKKKCQLPGTPSTKG